ncbi:MAG: GDSL-type esterase/lipase family protein [Akkermansiaceae bacterium]
MKLATALSLLSLLTCPVLEAALTLASPFTDQMVLQRGKPIPVWGKTEPRTKVIAMLGDQKEATVSDKNGAWRVNFKAMDANAEGQSLKVTSGKNQLIRKDILIGDVWIATGQSNMRWMLYQSTGGKKEIAQSADAGLRLFNHAGSLHPGGKKYTVEFLKKLTVENYYTTNGWQQCSPKSSANFSGVAYFFGKKLRQELKIPIGIVHYGVGGTPIEAHISPEVFNSDPVLKPLLNEWWKNANYPQWCRQRAAHNLTHWLADPELKRKTPPHPFAPHYLWDAGISRYLPLPVKGVLWYQGESNATVDGSRGRPVDGELNKQKFRALVRSWRQAWHDDALPVYHVQLPSLNRPWPVFREMQLQVSQELKHIGMAVTIDVGHPTNVHPANKKPVGDRLARLALHGSYGKSIIPNGPLYKRSVFKNGKAVIDFENPKGMKASDGKAIRGFEIAGSDKKFHPATAVVNGSYLEVSSKEVARPAAVRYAWANNPDCNLVNGENLPASPFRTDTWKNIKPTGNIDMGKNKKTVTPPTTARKKGVIRVACIGDSITYGSGIPNRSKNSYPAQLQKLLGDKYEVRNFGNPGRGVLKKSKRGKGKRAFIFMPEHAQAIKFEPHIVICNLGINDIMDWGRFGKADFVSDYRELIQAYKTLNTYPRVIVWDKLAPLFKGQKFYGDPQLKSINAAITTAAKLEKIDTLDMATPFKGKGEMFPDHIHPNADGAKIIAEQTAAMLKK